MHIRGDGERDHVVRECVRVGVDRPRALGREVPPDRLLVAGGQRPEFRRPERVEVHGVGLRDVPSRVDAIVERDQRAPAAGVVALCRPDGGQEVRRAVGAGQRGVSHRPREHDRRLAVVTPIHEVRRLLEDVCPLGDDHAVDVRIAVVFGDQFAQFVHLFDGEVRARNVGEVLRPECGALTQTRNARDEVLAGQFRTRVPTGVLGRRDCPAGRNDNDSHTRRSPTRG